MNRGCDGNCEGQVRISGVLDRCCVEVSAREYDGDVRRAIEAE